MKEQILAVQRMQDYIEANLDTDITMAELSKAALFSPWHSYRLFREYIGLTPADYVRRLRLARSALRLKTTLPRNRRRFSLASSSAGRL